MAKKQATTQRPAGPPPPEGMTALYDAVHVRAGDPALRRETLERVVRGTFEMLTDFLKRGRTVTLPGFGTFYVSQFKGGTIRLPGGGTKRMRPHRIPRFRSGEALKRAVRGR